MIHRVFLIAPLCLAGSSVLFSCRSSDSPDHPKMDHRVDNSMLQHVGDGERADVTEAREAADTARDAHAAAQVDTKKAIDRRKLADRDLDIAQAELKRAEAELKLAEDGTQEDLENARQSVADAKAVVASIRSRIALRDRQVDHAKAVEALKHRNHELAAAKVEATKAHAVRELDRPKARSIEVDKFEHQVRECQEKVKLAEVRVEAARREVDAARRSYDVTVEAVPASHRRNWPDEDEKSKD